MKSCVPCLRWLSDRRPVATLVILVAVAGAGLWGCSRPRLTPRPAAPPTSSTVPPALSATGLPQRAAIDLTPAPATGAAPVTPTSSLVAAPSASPSPTWTQPLVTIGVPEPGQLIYSPVYIRGQGSVPLERTIEAQVLSVDGEVLGRGPILFDAVTPVGASAAYEGTLHFRQPAEQQLGSVRVLVSDPRDSSIVDYAQVLVVLRQAGDGPVGITINLPPAGTAIGNPVHVEGMALAPQNQITVRLTVGPAVLASDTIPLAGEIGSRGRFSVDLSYPPLPALGRRPGYPAPSESTGGHIEVFYRSPADGRIAEIAAVPVVIPVSP